jgi:hypothetical protein
MAQLWRHLPPQARTVAAAAVAAVAAAGDRDVAEFDRAAETLAALDPERVGLVLGAVVRMLLEELHPNGLSGEDVQVVLSRCVRSAAQWLPDVDVDVLVLLLTGALGIHQPEEQARRLTPRHVARHAPLLVADLVAISGLPFADFLDTAFSEIERGETMELP